MSEANPVEHIRRWSDQFTKIRRDLHAHPELGFEEHRTARLVCDQLAAFGIEHHSGVGRTGIVAVIQGASDASGRRLSVALRRAHARLRPRRPHDDAARGGTLPARDTQLRRHRVPDFPAG
jgi:hippurate hydrolase